MAASFAKYTLFARNTIRRTLRHKGNLIGEGVLLTVLMTVFYQLWTLVEKQGGLADMTLTAVDIIWYCAITETILNSTPKIRVQIEQDIRSGDIAYFLIRPLSYFAMRFSEAFGHVVFRLPLYFILSFGLSYLYTGAFPSGVANIPWIVLVAPVCMVLQLLIHFTIALSALWIQDTSGFYMIYTKLVFVFSGLFIPLDFYPEWMQTIASYTPFGCVLYIPAQLIFREDAASLIFWMPRLVFWIALAFIAVTVMARICHKRITANGG